MSCAIALDVGGTFTDVTLLDTRSGRLTITKTPSTPADPSQGFLTGVAKALALGAASPDDLEQVLHGTTIATNAILEGKGVATGLLTTAGFRYVLEIGRHDIPRHANMFAWQKPPRPVSPELIFEIPERLAVDGDELTPMDEDAVRVAARRLREAGVDSVAICFLHSYANPAHERRAREILLAEHPACAVSLSSEVLPVFREYERSMATALNAYVLPIVGHYVGRLEGELRAGGVRAPLRIMKSNGGVIGADVARHQPIHTALSGPAAGVVGARLVGVGGGLRRPDLRGRRGHQRGRLPDPRRRGRGDVGGPSRRLAPARAHARRPHHRRGRGLDRPRRRGRHPHRGPPERGRRPRAGLLRHGRRGAHGDRRPSGTRPHPAGARRRGDPPRRRGGAPGDSREDRAPARPFAGGGGRRHPGHRQSPHGGRHPAGLRRARARSARVRPRALRGRRAAARRGPRGSPRHAHHRRAAQPRRALRARIAGHRRAQRLCAHELPQAARLRSRRRRRHLRRPRGRGQRLARRGRRAPAAAPPPPARRSALPAPGIRDHGPLERARPLGGGPHRALPRAPSPPLHLRPGGLARGDRDRARERERRPASIVGWGAQHGPPSPPRSARPGEPVAPSIFRRLLAGPRGPAARARTGQRRVYFAEAGRLGGVRDLRARGPGRGRDRCRVRPSWSSSTRRPWCSPGSAPPWTASATSSSDGSAPRGGRRETAAAPRATRSSSAAQAPRRRGPGRGAGRGRRRGPRAVARAWPCPIP